jgi:putative transposase
VRWSRPLPGKPSSVTVIRDPTDRYFASFVIEVRTSTLPATDQVIGIDLGLTHFAVLSDRRKIASPRFLRRAEKKLKRAQRLLSRKQKGSRNPLEATPGSGVTVGNRFPSGWREVNGW